MACPMVLGRGHPPTAGQSPLGPASGHGQWASVPLPSVPAVGFHEASGLPKALRPNRGGLL
eukprot:3950349-Lingulodinium_polyedra.AAC.1